MVDTSNRAELQNCITNAREVIRQMENRIGRLDGPEREELGKLTGQAEILLKEADDRCKQLF